MSTGTSTDKTSPGIADTVPASGDGDPESLRDRDRRPTIPDLVPPTEERYRLGAEIGRGGMGRVVEAFDTQLGRTVALKEVLPKGSAGVERRFAREVQITARLEHPSIVPLYDSGCTSDGRPFYVMRRVTGRPLDALLGRAEDLPARLVYLPNLLSAFDAVGHAHRRGVVHRDLKPANILVGENGETIVIDWGLAKVVGDEDDSFESLPPTPADSLQTQVGAVFGTPGFMPPEQARGERSTTQGDVFALGATLYQLLAGRPPISGSGPTEAIASTLQRRIVPIKTAAPNAPPELHAIVDKALALEPKDRYADAEQLAEDLRRFSTGQLVAAHRYTSRERIVRFARKNRAPLSVAALALAAVAVLAWIGVHRILVERDLAQQASLEAEAKNHEVEQLNRKLEDQIDAVLITRARAQLETNPTEALAMLKDLRTDSPRLAEARGLAAAAAARGVAWAFHAEGTPRFLVLDREARRLAEVTSEGKLFVWDLETHRRLQERTFVGAVAWLSDGRLLLAGDRTPAMVLDLRSGHAAPLGIGVLGTLSSDDAGAHVAFIDEHQGAGIFDAATGKPTAYWPGHAASSIELSPDGAWLAVADKTQTVVIDAASGATVASHPGELILLATTAGRFAGLAGSGGPAELARDDHGAWADAPLAFDARPTAFGPSFGMSYRAGRLEVLTGNGIEVFVNGTHYGHRNASPTTVKTDLAHDVCVMQAANGALIYYSDELDGTLALPMPLYNMRVGARRDRSRLAVAGAGIVLVYDFADILPTFVHKDGIFEGAFVDRDNMLLWPGNGDMSYSWWNLATHKHVDVDLGMPTSILEDRDSHDGRVLLYEPTGNTTAELELAHAGTPAVDHIVRGSEKIFGVLAPEGVLLTDGGARVLYSDHGAKPTELAKVEGGVDFIRVLDRRRFAALGRKGELVRGELTGGALERVRIDASDNTILGADREGDVVIANGTRLDLWPTGATLRPLAVLPRPIEGVEASGTGLAVQLDDKSVYYVEPNGTTHEVIAATSFATSMGGHGAWLATPGINGQIDIVELPSLAHWTLPKLFVPSGAIEVSPTGRRLAAAMMDGYMVYDLLEPGTDLAAWIDDHTNAVESPDGTLGWP
ncbi:MAG TPA: serine/threonine-protein kinase [Kofleriaceae bacterium]|jgi:cell division protein FtsB